MSHRHDPNAVRSAKDALGRLRRLLGNEGDAARLAREVEDHLQQMARDIEGLAQDRDRYKRRAKASA
jgi:hypothetical protein